jgi:hypothetical protein
MSFETVHATGNAHAAKSFPPRDGVRFRAAGEGQGIGRPGAPTDEAINLFFDVDERLFHVAASIGWQIHQCKGRKSYRTSSCRAAAFSIEK